MGYDTEQCPQRGPGLSHRTEDGHECDFCGKLRILTAPSLVAWLKMLRGEPRKLIVSGEPVPKPVPPAEQPDDERPLGDFATLTSDQWHRAVVVRAYYERHPERRG